MRKFLSVLAVCLVPAAALGVGGDEEPPPTTQTTGCQQGYVWDPQKQECVFPKTGNLTNDQLYQAVRELAYAGRFLSAEEVLEAMTEGDTDRVLTYRGYLARKQGNVEQGMALYARAIELNPDNRLVRSYRGQAYVEQGRVDLARAELREILARGGAGTWPAESLARAIATGVGYTY